MIVRFAPCYSWPSHLERLRDGPDLEEIVLLPEYLIDLLEVELVIILVHNSGVVGNLGGERSEPC